MRKIRLVCVVWSWIIIGFRFGFNLYKKRKIIFSFKEIEVVVYE